MNKEKTKKDVDTQMIDGITREQIYKIEAKLYAVEGYLTLLGEVLTTGDGLEALEGKIIYLNSDMEEKIGDVVNIFASLPEGSNLIIEKEDEVRP
jgi:hypothetical protein